jgi:hypothetical protein
MAFQAAVICLLEEEDGEQTCAFVLVASEPI